MSKLTVQLHRNLRKTILRGHPWVYRDSVTQTSKVDRAQLCRLNDAKNEFLAWAIFDPHSPLCLRVLSLENKPPTELTFESRMAMALSIRNSVVSTNTNCFRLFNGEGDLLPGMVCDIYAGVAVLQFDGQGPSEFWDKLKISKWLVDSGVCRVVVEKLRRHSEGGLVVLAGELEGPEIEVIENGARFKVDIEKGQKTGFFLDQRENRNYIQSVCKDKSVLNLFSYTGGFSIHAGLGQASRVASLDVAAGAIETAKYNWQLNGLAEKDHVGLCVDVFEYLKGDTESWDHIIVDPPSMGHSEEHKERARIKYIELFIAAIKKVKPHGQISLSSCSSHINFEDFFEIISESLSQCRRRGRILRVSGQGPDHPYPHSCPELRYLKFVHLVLS